jgi:glycosyltransferase involved in cell wall biosynthesis
MIPLKRIDLIINGLTEFIKQYDREVIWTHFGEGELYSDINNQAKQILDVRFKYILKGFVDNNVLLKYYQENPVDLFITTSESEGVPISLLEAQTYGIPVIGTNIGGIPEIINNEVGVLLSSTPSSIEIATAINNIVSATDRHKQIRTNSVSNWANHFDESINYPEFASNISN